MLLKQIKHGLVTVALGPEECRLLGRACETARDSLSDDDGATHVETLGAAFEAAALAGLAQMYMRPGDLARMLREAA